jgi:hypothetical protein
MNKRMKTIIVIVIAVAIIIPVSIVAYISYNSSQDNPISFIPSNSTFLVKINYNSSNYFAFGGTQGLAIMLPLSKSVSVSNQNLSFNSTRIPISTYGNFGGFTIYNISLSDVIYSTLENLTVNKTISNLPLDSFMNNVTSYSLYFYEPYSNEIIIGSLVELKNSINSYNHGNNFSSKAKYINNPGSVDFYLHYNSTTVWGNSSSNNTYIFVQGNHSFISSLYNESGYFSLMGYKMKQINSTTIEIIVPIKLNSRTG